MASHFESSKAIKHEIDRAMETLFVRDHEPFRHYYLPKLRGERGLAGTAAAGSTAAGTPYELQSLQFCDREMTDEDCDRIADGIRESWGNFGPDRCSLSALRVISLANNAMVTNRGVQAIIKVIRELGEGASAALHTLDFTNIGEPLSAANIKDLVLLTRASSTLRTVQFTGCDAPEDVSTAALTMWFDKEHYGAADAAGNALLNTIPAAAKVMVRATAMCDSGMRHIDLSKPATRDDVNREFPKTYGPTTVVSLLVLCLRTCNSVNVLDFSNNNIGDDKTAILAEILKTNTTILELHLRNNDITTRGALSLFHALRDGPNKTLLELDVINNGITDVAVKELLAIIASDVTALGIVRLEKNCTSPALISRVFHALAINTQHPAVKKMIPKLEANDSKVTRLGFEKDDTDLDDTSMKVILQALRKNTYVTSIDFSNSSITDEGAFFVAEMMEALPKLRKVICKFNKIGEEGARRLLRAIPKALQVELVDLKFQDPPLSHNLLCLIEKVAGLSSQPKALKDIGLPLSENNPDITTVDLSVYDGVQRCNDNTVSTLGVLLENNTMVNMVNLSCNKDHVTVLSVPIIMGFAWRLRELDLSNNGFRDLELQLAMQELLANPQCRLETLRLAQNNLTNDFSHALCMSLRNHNERITFVDVSQNRLVLPADVAEVKYYCDLNTHSKLFKSIIRTVQDDETSTLKELNFCVIEASVPLGTSNVYKREFTDLSVFLLCGALKVNHTVQLVNLSGNQITNQGAKTIADYLRENTTLTHLDVSHNSIGDEGIVAITEAIKANSMLKAFVFNNNPLKDPDTQRRLIQALQHNNAAVGSAYTTAHNMRAKQEKEVGFTTEDDERTIDKMIDDAIFVDALKDLKMLEKLRGSAS